jgi:hypothetical protein
VVAVVLALTSAAVRSHARQSGTQPMAVASGSPASAGLAYAGAAGFGFGRIAGSRSRGRPPFSLSAPPLTSIRHSFTRRSSRFHWRKTW